MAIKFNRSQAFATNGTVTAAGLHNLIDGTDIYQALITDQTDLSAVATDDKLLIADASLTAGDAPRSTTVQNLFDDALTGGTYTNANISGIITFGTATGNRTISTSATITTGTIPNLTSSTASITLGTIPTLTAGTTTSTAANITNGTVQTLTASTANITVGTYSGAINSTLGTIATLNSTTGTITNLSTTLAGDFTISQGTATLATSGATAGTYGSVTAIPFITVDAKGRITSATTGTFSSTPADGSITPAKLSQPLTSATAVTTSSGTAIDFTSIPSWVRRITVMFNAVSTNGVSPFEIRIGSGSIDSTGYASGAFTPNTINTGSTTGFILTAVNYAAAAYAGSITLLLQNSASYIWVSSGVISDTVAPNSNGGGNSSGGVKTLSGVLDRIRITTTGGANTFDGGSINIMYEG